MASDTLHASLRSAPQRKRTAHPFFYISAIPHMQGAPAAYNPSGAPYAGAFYMGR